MRRLSGTERAVLDPTRNNDMSTKDDLCPHPVYPSLTSFSEDWTQSRIVIASRLWLGLRTGNLAAKLRVDENVAGRG